MEIGISYITQSAGHSTIIPVMTQSTGHSAITPSITTQSTGHSAITPSMEPMEVTECNNAEVAKSTGNSAAIDMDGLIASFISLEISEKVTGFPAYLPPSWPKKQNMYVGMDTSPERYIENPYMLGMAWVQKVQHVSIAFFHSSLFLAECRLAKLASGSKRLSTLG